jgi:hypothetical protein
MMGFFEDFAKALQALPIQQVVAVDHLRPSATRSEVRTAKRAPIFAALSRLDRNLQILMGRHIDTPELFIDQDPDQLITPHGQGFIAEWNVVNIGLPDRPELVWRRTIDPSYKSLDSRGHRLIQLADVAAYFVGKKISLHESLLGWVTTGQPLYQRIQREIQDCNFSLKMWNLLNLEVITVVDQAKYRHPPRWMKPVIGLYAPLLQTGPDAVFCSLRECVEADGRKTGDVVNGLGYWAIV